MQSPDGARLTRSQRGGVALNATALSRRSASSDQPPTTASRIPMPTASAQTELPGGTRGDGRGPDRRGSVVGIARGPHRQHVQREQLEHRAHPESRVEVAQERARHGGRDERAGQHGLGHADEVEPSQRPPGEEQQHGAEA